MNPEQKGSLFSRLKKRFFDESNPMEYRISMIFFIVALFASILSATTNTLLGKGLWGVVFQWTFIALMVAFMFAPRRVQLRLFRPLVIVSSFLYIPFLFTQTAGYDGTALMFTLLCVFVISVAFEGRKRAVLIILNVLLLAALCVLEFLNPSWIVPHAGEQAKLMDQLVALVVTVFAMAVLSIYIIDALKKGVQHNQQLLAELEQKNRSLAEISHIFINLRHDDDSVRRSMDIAADFLGCDAIVFWEKEAHADRLLFNNAWRRDTSATLHASERVFSPGTLLYDSLLAGGGRYVTYEDAHGAWLAVPIKVDGEFWGVVEFAHHRQLIWSDSDIQLSILLTSIFASYFERREYEASIERQLAQQSLTSRIAGRFINIDNLQGRVDESIRDIGVFLGCEAVEIHHAGARPGMLALGYEWRREAAGAYAMKLRYTDEIAGALRRREEPYLIDEQKAEDGTVPASTLLAPLYMGTAFSGVLAVVFPFPHRWLDSEIQLCLLFGATYSVVMERNLQSEQLMEAKTKAEAANRAKSDFLSSMSHEIRTPMNAIIGLTEIGLSTDECEKQRECLSSIRTASAQLLTLINDILDISKIESGKIELEQAPFDFKEMIDALGDTFHKQAAKKRQTFTVMLDQRLHECYIGDRTRIEQVITNLLSNAVKFTPEGGHVSLKADQVAQKDGKTVLRVSVADTGIGIQPEHLERIFNAFEQADNSITRRYGGTGLGLSISKNLVEKMGGHIWVASNPGGGSEFTFDLSLQQCHGTEAPEHAREAQAARLRPDAFAGITILLVEDIQINREIFEELLAGTGIQIDSVANGAEAVEAFESAPERYAIIFMDIQMPVMDGLEATRRIRALDIQRAKTVPIVAMTANVFQEDIQRSLSAGMNDHLGKPIDIQKVYEKIMHYTGKA